MKPSIAGLAAFGCMLLAGCRPGPHYLRPDLPLAPELDTFKEGWKPAQPADQGVRGPWWEMYGDTQLNALEAQIDQANQSLKQAEANFQAARASLRVARSAEAPTISTAPAAGAVRDSANQPYFNQANANNGEGSFSLPLDLNYEVDLWGRVRREVTSQREEAQASAADMEAVRLSLHAELAIDYFDLRSADAQEKLLDETVKAYKDAVQLTQDRYDGGVAPLSDVEQAQTQLQSAQVLDTDTGIARAQYEHAIAVLIGKPPSALSLSATPLTVEPPALPDVPVMLPSELLERRPDIAAEERRMASANERIGIAETAFYPTLSISAAAGYIGTSAVNWFDWPSRFWAVGPMVSQTLFDGGRRRANAAIATSQYDAQVASYRQTSLTAFQQVEDHLAAIRLLKTEAGEQAGATESAQQSLELFKTRYEGGVDTYLQVITSQTAALQNERNDIEILRRQLESSVLLVKALGGGWSMQKLPQP